MPPVSSPPAKAPRILAVDDQPENLELLAAILSDEGFDVGFASDGLAALEAVAAHPPQAILLDIMMPRLDGFEVCRRIKAARPTCFIPVVMLTALSDVESKIRGFENGADDFLNKPFHRIELLTRLRSLLRIRGLRDELDSTEALIFSMVHLLEEKDPLTRDHSQRVAAIAADTGRARKLSSRAQYNLTLGALLHDIGKLGVPESILLKQDAERTAEDQRIYRLHTALGERILAPIDSLAGAIPFVRQHHERRDGSGYPNGAVAAELAPEVELLAAANAYDMTRATHPSDLPARAEALRQEARAGRFETALVEEIIRAGERLEAAASLPTIEELLPAPEIDPGGRILVADDNSTNRQLYRELLQGAGYQVETANGGEAALAAYRKTKPDLMILDIRMPDIDGQEVCRIIKADESAAYLPVILVTAYEQGLRLRALDCSADELLLAPVNRLELLARVRSLLRLKIYYQDLVRHESVVLSLSAALEAKDPYTRGHSQRVGELSTRLARELGQDTVVVQRMRTAGLLHDIGKVAIPQSLLNKPGRLTSEEFTKLMTHPVVGWEICKPLRTAQSVLDCILYHHERFDGCGYPEGLSGEAIPYQARLLAVADALDALTSERAYRSSLSVDQAVELLGHETAAGKWDPEISAALTRLAQRGQADPRRLEV
jgi:putative two-component system response regulator